nr:hypothetical protein [Tanacetum cinerariifolium]
TFWAEAVNTACYVQNRVLVNKSHNKTPYELFNGRSPAIGFLKPFGCHVMILNTLDNLGKFEEKANKGYFIRYSMSSKAFRVFNKRTRRVEENLHVEFLENKAIEKGVGPNWLFDIDSLTKSMNYVPVDTGTISTNLSGTKDAASQEPQDHCSSEVPEGSGYPNPTASTSNPPTDQIETLTVETLIPNVSSPVLTAYSTDSQEPSSDARLISKRVANQEETPSLDNILSLTNRFEDIFRVTTNSDESNGVEADISNMETAITASPTPTLRIHKDHPKRVRPIGTKWVLKNKKDERGIVIKNKARLVAQRHTQEERINYDEVFTPVARIEAIRLFLAYASFMGFTVYQMDVKSAFLYGTIDEEVYVMQPPGFYDPESPAKVYKVEKAMYGLHQAPRAWYGTLSKYLLKNSFQRGTIDQTLFIKRQRGDFILVQVYVDDIIFGSSNPQLCREFKALMHEKFQMSAMGELNFFLGLQVLQKEDGIFLSQDKYTIMATSTTEAEYVTAASYCGQVLWIQNQLLDYGDCFEKKLISVDHIHTDENVADLLTKPFDARRFQYLVVEHAMRGFVKGILNIYTSFKSEHNIDFHPMVDFIEASPLRYALIVKPTMYVSHIRQFWSTARIETTKEGTQILTTVDGIHRTVTESSLRRNLKLQNEKGISSLPDKEGEGSGTPTEPHHTSSREDQSPSHTTHTSPTLPPVTSTSIPTVTQTETTLSDISQGEACPIDSGFIADQDRVTIDKSSTLPHDSAPRVTSPVADEGKLTAKFQAQEVEINRLKERVKMLEDREGVAATRSVDDAPIKGRSMDEGEAATERISDDSEEMATVLTSMDAATVLASGVVDVPTGSGSIPTASIPTEEQVPTGSDVVPTASLVFATATVVTPYRRRKGKEVMVESKTPKKQKVQEQIDAQVARELEEQLEREDQRRSEQIARDAEIERIHAEEELQIMINGLDRNNETIAKYLQEYHQFASELPIKRRIELITDLMEDFIPMGSKEEAERIKRKGLNLEQESAKKQKKSEEVPEEAMSPKEVPEEKSASCNIQGQRNLHASGEGLPSKERSSTCDDQLQASSGELLTDDERFDLEDIQDCKLSKTARVVITLEDPIINSFQHIEEYEEDWERFFWENHTIISNNGGTITTGKVTKVPQPSDPMEHVADEAVHKELGDSLLRAATTASSLEAKQVSGNINRTQSKATPNESSSQGTSSGCGPKCQEAMKDTIAQTRFENVSKQSNDSLLARADAEMFDDDKDLGGEEMFVEQEVVADKEEIDEVTLAKAFAELKASKPKDKGVVIQEPSESPTTTTTIPKQKSHDNGKGILVEEHVKPKKKDQIRLDKEAALKLPAEFDEEQRRAREKAKKELEANIALIETWDDVQENIDDDHQLAERLQAKDQQELADEEKATLFI